MKKIIICSILSFFVLIAFGQISFPFGQNSATWTYWRDQGLGNSTDLSQYTLFYSGKDSLIGDKKYAIITEGRGSIKKGEINTIYFLREENHKVFFFDSDMGETLLYDFSDLKIGDSLLDKDFFNATDKDIITSIDTIILLDGTSRKRYTILENYSYLIEGIGSTLELFPHTYQLAEYTAGLICHRVKEEELYLNEKSILFNGECFLVTSLKDKKIEEEIFIYPNPVMNSGGINISIPSNKFNTSIIRGYIYTMSGKKIKQFTVNYQQQNIGLDNIPEGIYLIKLFGNEYSLSKKMIVLRN